MHNISEISEDYSVHQLASRGEVTILLKDKWRYYLPQTDKPREIDTEGISLRMSEDNGFEPLTSHAYRYTLGYPDIIHVKEKEFIWEIPGIVDLLTSSGTIIKAESLRAEFMFKQRVAQVPLVTSRLYEENGQIKAFETSIEAEHEGSKVVVTCYLAYDQASDRWNVVAEPPDGQIKWFAPSEPAHLQSSSLKTTFDE